MGKKHLTMRMVEMDDDYQQLQQTEVTVQFSDEAAWHEMLPFFLHFLEGAGYLGVVNKMTDLIEGDVYDSDTFIKPFAWEPENE
jgi:quercetin dioxygenase-like cupin family protein